MAVCLAEESVVAVTVAGVVQVAGSQGQVVGAEEAISSEGDDL